MKDHSGLSNTELTAKIWDLVWKGWLSNDSFEAVRKGIQSRFKTSMPANPRTRRRKLDGWRESHPMAGGWYLLRRSGSDDLLEAEEDTRDYLAQLFDRYGILCRDIISKDPDSRQWARLFRTLRLMELSGDVSTGYFLKGLSSPQFAVADALDQLRQAGTEQEIYWMNAMDPASPCGLPLASYDLPRRLATNHLVFHGRKLVLVSERNGSRLKINIEADSPLLPKYLEFFREFLSNPFRKTKSVRVRTINGKPVDESSYSERLVDWGFLRDYKVLVLRAGYR
jgi:ATP-dependent Lhr-like helicase